MLRIAAALGIAAGLTLAAPPAAHAQAAGAGPPAPSAQKAAERAAERERERQARIQRRAQKLRQALQLRPDQERALMAYMAVLYPPRREDAPSTRNLTTPQKLDIEYSRRVQRLNDWKREADATKTFYNQLSAQQRAAADAMDLLAD